MACGPVVAAAHSKMNVGGANTGAVGLLDIPDQLAGLDPLPDAQPLEREDMDHLDKDALGLGSRMPEPC
ncbi:hypothetical protein SAMN04488042_105174 [Shimia aestuarii]|uniref:Uncharacterized protein n=1 Tax=Shimia aestuarii TaxID=254406 RepID=A0A1I4PCM4_9RHOB|nr:hypothetical protein SAMN04488042_105174 [Shimia aestuarii]